MNSSRKAWFTHYGLNDTHPEVEVSVSRFNYTAVTIKRGALRSKKFAIEGHCANLYHYLFLEEGEQCKILTLYAIRPLILYYYIA